MKQKKDVQPGMAPGEARRRVRMRFGAVGAARDDHHAEEGLPFVENLLLDVRYALRLLRKSPAFTAVALLTLTLGIGANVVVLGVLNAVLLDPLDVSDPQSLYQMRHKQWMIGRLLTTSYPAFEDFRQRNTTFSAMAGIYGYSVAGLRWHNEVRTVHGDEVTGNYFDLLGVQPELGRFFHAVDERGPDSAPYVVLSDNLWRSLFQADRTVVGTTVELNQHPFTVVGVAPSRFHGTERFVWPDYWMPMVNEEQVEGSDYLRDVSWHDNTQMPYVAIVNETFARKMWGKTPAIGQRFILWGKLTEVVGLVEDGKYHDLQESPQAVAYPPVSQNEQSETVFVVRSRLALNEMRAALERTLSEPNVTITVHNWSDTLEGELFPARAATVALGVMGLLAAMLAVTGIFGMATYSVSRRMKELGIRVALGARTMQLMRAAVGRPILLLGVGSVLGLLAGIPASRLLGQIVYRADPLDPVVVGGAVLTMALLGIAASAIPARRALAVDPSKLMREE
jgi:MacB-like protein/FtsX-like permease family protein